MVTSTLLVKIVGALVFLILAPVLGCLLAGVDRRITARMQHRVGPPLLQPYYDVRKLLAKEDASTNPVERIYIFMYLIFIIAAGCLFFSGGNFLLVVFILTLATLFLIVAAFSSRSPYAEIGASREILQVMSYEPMVLLVAVGFYMVTGTFDTAGIVSGTNPVVCYLPLLFLGFVYILTIKLRKSPFDLSMSHHAHQEIVKGITTEMSGKTLAIVEVSHWYENILFLGWVALFLAWGSWIGVVVAIVLTLLIYLLEIFIDNNFARVKWQAMLTSSWWIALVAGAINLATIPFIMNLF
ncbi:MAG: NADH-quinone oxidoreductase subunit H [Actinobacteria bacterium]|nr:NADH-quinone oxidoreductase subunit H [Actinomycetota bacterium]